MLANSRNDRCAIGPVEEPPDAGRECAATAGHRVDSAEMCAAPAFGGALMPMEDAECRLPEGGSRPRSLRIDPLRLRVDRTRIRFVVFFVAFVLGSAVILALPFVAVPG
jgi:hypothetical protein